MNGAAGQYLYPFFRLLIVELVSSLPLIGRLLTPTGRAESYQSA
jgi:hypothetical protein